MLKSIVFCSQVIQRGSGIIVFDSSLLDPPTEVSHSLREVFFEIKDIEILDWESVGGDLAPVSQSGVLWVVDFLLNPRSLIGVIGMMYSSYKSLAIFELRYVFW